MYMCNSIPLDGCTYPNHFQTDVIIETSYSVITIFQGNDNTMFCLPSKLDIALEWSYE